MFNNYCVSLQISAYPACTGDQQDHFEDWLLCRYKRRPPSEERLIHI